MLVVDVDGAPAGFVMLRGDELYQFYVSRAARFYEKCGWTRTGTFTDQSVIEGGTFPIEAWRYEKALTRVRP